MADTTRDVGSGAPRAALDREPAAVCILGATCERLYANPAFETLEREVRLTLPSSNETCADDEMLAARARRVLATGEAWLGELPLLPIAPSTPGPRHLLVELIRFGPATGPSLLVVARDATTDTHARLELEHAAMQMRQEVERTRLLMQAARALSVSLQSEKVLGTLAEVTLRLVEHARVDIILWDAERKQLSTAVSKGTAARPPGRTLGIEQASHGAREALETRRTIIVDLDELPEAARGPGELRRARRALIVPLVGADDVLGIIVVDDPGERRSFTEREIRIVEGVASQAAVAIQNALLFEERSRQASYAEALNRINEAVHSTLDFDDIMDRVVVEANEAFGSESAAIVLKCGDEWVTSYATGFRDDEIIGMRTPEGQREFMRSLETLQDPLVVEDAWNDDRLDQEWMRRFSFRAFLAAPLFTRGSTLGVMFFNYHEAPRPIDPVRADFARKLSASVSLALENARLYAIEHGIAQTLQAALLALPESVAGVSFSHVYHSATEEARVGGDFYDLFELEHGRLGITVGDVAGKGVDAAVLTSLVKNTVRAHATERGRSPGDVLRMTNEMMYRSTPTESFVTTLFGILDCRDGRFVYSNAGHTTAAVVRADGDVTKLPANSPILGAFPGAPFVDSETTLDVGELLFLYTDGLSEARRDRELFGEDRLFVLLSENRDGDATEIIHEIVHAIIGFTGARLSDDLAILAVRRTGDVLPPSTQQKLEL